MNKLLLSFLVGLLIIAPARAQEADQETATPRPMAKVVVSPSPSTSTNNDADEMGKKIEKRDKAFKEGLKNIKDKKSQEKVTKILGWIDDLNAKFTKQFSLTLDALDMVIDKITTLSQAAAGGKDTTTLMSALTNAKDAIKISREAVRVQSIKVYSITLNGDKTLYKDVNKTRQTFEDDIKKVRDTVKSAHKAVRAVADSLKQLLNPDTNNMSTSPSPNASVSPNTSVTPDNSNNN